jgi:hypothetical protein
MKASPRVLSTRALNRALLARQWLLGRVRRSVPSAIEHLVGLQAQNTPPPYVALWSRLEAFAPEQLSRMLLGRRAVRLALMRSTIHLVTARDCLALRPLLQPALERNLMKASPYGRRLAGIDLQDLAAAGRAMADEAPRTTAELGALLAKRFRGSDAEALGNGVRALLALVQLPPRGVWGAGGLPRVATAEAWLGRPLARKPDAGALARRYLAAFGPASAADLQTWSGLGLPECKQLLESLRPTLRTFADERGRELFDVARAPLPDPEMPAPPRFLPEYDNAFLGYADRTRIVATDDLPLMRLENGFASPFLVDGFVRGTWKLQRAKTSATVIVEPARPLKRAERAAVEEEGERLVAFLAPEAAKRGVRIA